MSRFFLVLLILCIALPLGGCGGDDAPSWEAEVARTPDQAPAGESKSRIPEEAEPPESAKNVFIKLYFDEEGTRTEFAAAPGETFTLYVFAEYPEPYHISAAEYRLEIPNGIKVDREEKFGDRCLTMGSYKNDFSIAWECREPGKFYMMKYVCIVEPGFTGGIIKLAPGVNPHGDEYLGFVSCQPETGKLPATPGNVTIVKR